MSSKVYVLEALRNGIREDHSYPVCTLSDKQAAIKYADQHCTDRAGKYSVVVHEFILDATGILEGTEVYRAKARFDNPEYYQEWLAKRYPNLKS